MSRKTTAHGRKLKRTGGAWNGAAWANAITMCRPYDTAAPVVIPGLIEGAAEGAGLGHRFLRHLQRTGVLLHLVDLAPFDDNIDPVADAVAIVNELRKYDEALVEKPRWLVLNKVDMISEEDRKKVVADFIKRFKWKGPVFEISALTGLGCDKLCYSLQDYLDSVRKDRDDADERAADPRYQEQAQPEDKTPE